MHIGEVDKDIDYSKQNVGMEIEAMIVDSDTLRTVSAQESHQIMQTLIDDYGWEHEPYEYTDEVYMVKKEIKGTETEIALDGFYSIYEISTPSPLENLEQLEENNAVTLHDLKNAAVQNNKMIWPFGVAPASMNLFNLPFETRIERTTDPIYGPLKRLEYQRRFGHITSHQVNIDIALEHLMPLMNALFKNLGTIIDTFARSPLRRNGKVYQEGRYFYWNEVTFDDPAPALDSVHYDRGARPIFPPREFEDLADFFDWNWGGQFSFIMRDGKVHTFEDLSTTPHDYLSTQKGIVHTPEGDTMEVELNVDDIKLQFHMSWLDFRPHLEFDDFTVEDFISFYKEDRISEFLDTYCKHAYIEVRPCSPHLENNAMNIPRYFYDIFSNPEEYIRQSEGISWEEARERRNKAIIGAK